MVANISDFKVLAVEDSFEAMNLLRSMLTNLGVNQVYTAKNGKDALEFLGMCDDMVDVIVCDWNMPVMSGLELLKQVRTADPDIPFLMVTGTRDSTSVLEAKASGVTAYIAKPYSQDELKRKLGIVLRVLKHRLSMA